MSIFKLFDENKLFLIKNKINMKRKPGQKKSIFAEKGMRLVRSWETMMLLAESNKSLSSKEINDLVHRDHPFSLEKCSVQTTNEDLKTLQKCGFPVCRVDKNNQEIIFEEGATQGKFKNTKWRLRDPSKLGEFTSPYLRQPSASDIVSLSLCRALLKDEIPSQYPFRNSVSKMLEELQLRLNKRLRHGDSVDNNLHDRILHMGKKYVGKSVSGESWTRITTGIARKQVLFAEYENRDGEIRKVDIAPLAVWFSDGRAYVLAAGATDKKVRSWRIDRFSNIRVAAKKKASQISDKVIEDTLRISFKGYISDPVKIHLEVKSEVAYLFREFQYHPSQKVTDQHGGRIDVTMECALGWGLEEWILGFGEFIIVKGPNELKRSILKRLESAIKQLTT